MTLAKGGLCIWIMPSDTVKRGLGDVGEIRVR